MREEYDFSNAVKNPYVNKMKGQMTISLDSNTLEYFKTQSEAVGVSCQALINMYLRDCAVRGKKL